MYRSALMLHFSMLSHVIISYLRSVQGCREMHEYNLQRVTLGHKILSYRKTLRGVESLKKNEIEWVKIHRPTEGLCGNS